jgi:hypothetical protein
MQARRDVARAAAKKSAAAAAAALPGAPFLSRDGNRDSQQQPAAQHFHKRAPANSETVINRFRRLFPRSIFKSESFCCM